MTRVNVLQGEVTNKEIVTNIARNLLTIAEVVLSEIEDFDQFDESDLAWMQERVEAENAALYELCANYFGKDYMMEVRSEEVQG